MFPASQDPSVRPLGAILRIGKVYPSPCVYGAGFSNTNLGSVPPGRGSGPSMTSNMHHAVAYNTLAGKAPCHQDR